MASTRLSLTQRTILPYIALVSQTLSGEEPLMRAALFKDESALTVQDVATYLRVNAKTVYRLAQAGGIPGFKVAGTWRFRRHDIDRWIEDQQRRSIGRRKARA
jgi:excisionase family DNA binding protein